MEERGRAVMEAFEAYGGGGVVILLGINTRERVKELLCEGRWLLSTESAREKKDAFCGVSMGCEECAERMNCVIWEEIIGRPLMVPPRLLFVLLRIELDEDATECVLLRFVVDCVGVVVVGVGGYECPDALEEEELRGVPLISFVSSRGTLLNWRDGPPGAGTFVRVLNDNAASV